MRSRDLDHHVGMLSRSFGFAEPHVDQTGVEVRVRGALRMMQPLGELERGVGAVACAVGAAVHPQHHSFDDLADHAGVVAGLETFDLARRGFVRRDAPFEVVDRRLEVGEHAFARPDHDMAFDARPRVVEAFSKREELLADPHRLLEICKVDVEGREPAQHREELRDASLRLAEVQRALIRAFGLARVALGRQQDSGQARLQQNLLQETLVVRGCRREHVEEIPDERRGFVMPTAALYSSHRPSVSFPSSSKSSSPTQ